MGLVSIVALFLAGIATAYLFRGYLNQKQQEMAVLMSIGAKQREIYLLFSFQLILLGTLASVLAIFISLLVVPVFPIIFKGLIPMDVNLSTDPVTILLALGMGMAGSLVFCLPVFVRIFGVKPLILLRGEGGRGVHGMIPWQVISFFPGLVSVFSIVRHETRKNENQVNLLKVLGADFKAVQGITLLEFGFIGFTASLFVLILSFGFSRAISFYFFDSLWQFDLKASFLILLLTTFICMGTAMAASRKVMNTKPVKLLANR